MFTVASARALGLTRGQLRGPRYLRVAHGLVAELDDAIDQAERRRLALHFAIFEPGFLRNVFSYWRLGRLTPGSFVKFYFGGDNGYMARGRGVTFGLPPSCNATGCSASSKSRWRGWLPCSSAPVVTISV